MKVEERMKDVADFVVEHPVVVSGLGGLISSFGGFFGGLGEAGLVLPYLGYLGLSSWQDHFSREETFFEKDEKTIVDRILDHPKIAAVAGGSALAYSQIQLMANRLQVDISDLEVGSAASSAFLTFGVGAMASEAAFSLLRHKPKEGRGVFRGFFEKRWNDLMYGLPAATGLSAMVWKTSKEFEHFNEKTYREFFDGEFPLSFYAHLGAGSLLWGLGTYTVGKLVASGLHGDSLRRAKEWFWTVPPSDEEEVGEYVNLLEKRMYGAPSLEDRFYLSLQAGNSLLGTADMLCKDDDEGRKIIEDCAEECFNQAVALAPFVGGREVSYPGLFRRILNPLLKQYGENPFDDNLFAANVAYIRGNTRKSRQVLRTMDKDTLSQKVGAASLLDLLGERREANDLWDASFYEAFHRGEDDEIEGSRNTVTAIGEGSSTFILKEAEAPSSLEHEFSVSQWLFDIHNNKLLVPRPVHFDSDDGVDRYAMVAIPGVDLISLSEGREVSQKEAREVLRAYANYVSVAAKAKDRLGDYGVKFTEFDHYEDLEKNFYYRLSEEGRKVISLEALKDLCKRLDSYKYFVEHGDFHPGNVLYSSSLNHLSIIDPERMRLGSPFIGSSTLLGSSFVRFEGDVDDLHDAFVEDMYARSPFPSRDGLVLEQWRAALYANLRKLGTGIKYVREAREMERDSRDADREHYHKQVMHWLEKDDLVRYLEWDEVEGVKRFRDEYFELFC